MRRLISRLLVAAGLAVLAWCALVVLDGRVSQWLARQSLEVAISRGHETSSSASAPAPLTAVPVPAPAPPRGSPIASISIPRVHLSAVVLHGSDSRTLRRGPGHVEQTPLPGEPGNIVIAGHRDTFFGPLQFVKPGDDIYLDAPQGRFHYRAASMRVVNPRDLSVLDATRTPTLTLITCYPFWVFGNAPDRFIVRAVRVDDERAVATTGTISQAWIDVAKARTAVTTPPGRRAPVVTGVSRTDTPAPTRSSPPVLDDETLVRAALTRFRLAYNARIASHGDAVPASLLSFIGCDISITGDHADASCRVPSTADSDSPAWTFTLDRADGAWAIRSVVRP